MDDVANKEFLSTLLEDHIPGLVVEGCDHLTDEALERTKQRLMPSAGADEKVHKYSERIQI